MVFFSELKDKQVIDKSGIVLGSLCDFIFTEGKGYADITHFVYKCKDKYKKCLSWDHVEGIVKSTKTHKHTLKLNKNAIDLHPRFIHQKDLLANELLDKQVIDVSGLKVVRINDLLLNKVEGDFGITGVCVGTTSFLRRLFCTHSMIGKYLLRLTKEKIIQWKYVESFEKHVHLKEPGTKIGELHPGDIADIMEELSPKEQMLIFNRLDKKVAAKALVEADSDVQESFFRESKISRIVELLDSLPAHRAEDMIELLSEDKQKEILTKLKKEKARRVRELLKYPEDTAGAVMSTDFFTLRNTLSAAKAIAQIRKEKPSADKIHVLLVADKDNKLLGTISMRTLLTASPHKKLQNFMNKQPITVQAETSMEDVATALEKYNYFMLPVVNENNVLKGIVTADEVLSEIMPERWIRRKFVPKLARKRKKR